MFHTQRHVTADQWASVIVDRTTADQSLNIFCIHGCLFLGGGSWFRLLCLELTGRPSVWAAPRRSAPSVVVAEINGIGGSHDKGCRFGRGNRTKSFIGGRHRRQKGSDHIPIKAAATNHRDGLQSQQHRTLRLAFMDFSRGGVAGLISLGSGYHPR